MRKHFAKGTAGRRILILLSICFLLVWGCEECTRRVFLFGAGSYPFVETWHIEAPEDEVISAIIELKREDPSLQPPGREELVSVRDTANSSDYWRFTNFYYADSKKEVMTWTRPGDSTSTTFALVGFIDPGSSDIKHINQDFWYVANKLAIRRFEKRIVNRIKDKIVEQEARAESIQP